MPINFKLDKDDLIKFHSRNMVKTELFKKVKYMLYIIFLTLTVLLWILTMNKLFVLEIAFIGVIASVFFKYIGKANYRHILKKQFNEENNSFMFQEMEVAVNENQLYFRNSTEERFLNFKAINSINLVDGYLLIVLYNMRSIIVPLSVFVNEEEKNKFIALIKEKANKDVINAYPGQLK